MFLYWGQQEGELLKDAWYKMGHGSTGGLNLCPCHIERLGLYVEFSGWKCTDVAGRAHNPYIWKSFWCG